MLQTSKERTELTAILVNLLEYARIDTCGDYVMCGKGVCKCMCVCV